MELFPPKQSDGKQLFDSQLHTCDTFLNPNREIWIFGSGNVCLVSGGFHVANFGLFYLS